MQYDIFISYKRRGTSSATAAFVYDFLVRKGYTVFFDRKEMGQGYFDDQLYEYINKAKDIIVLLEESSLNACFSADKEAYKTDWFCKEIMHALDKKKRIIPLLLEDYKMPEEKDMPQEMKDLTKQNAIVFESVNIDYVYENYFINKKYLLSFPRNMYLSQLQGEGIADFLFYSKGDAEIYEFGNLIGNIDQSIDEEHPFKLPVRRTGEHRFRVENLDTSEVKNLKETINRDEQRYVEVVWQDWPNLWENDLENLEIKPYQFGLALYKGNSKHEPNLSKALKCFKQDWKDGLGFIKNHVNEIVTDHKDDPKLVEEWLETAASCSNPSISAMLLLAQMYRDGDILGKNMDESATWFLSAAKLGNPVAYYNIGLMYKNGLGVEKDIAKAIRFLNKALEARMKEASLPLAQIYYYKNEFKKAKNLVEAVLKKAPANQEALDLLNSIKQKTAAEKVQNMQKMF